MLLIHTTILADRIRSFIPCTLLSAAQLPFASAALAAGTLSWVVPKRWSERMDRFMYRAYMRLCLFVFENLSGVQLHLYGDVDVLRRSSERVLVVSNHQSDVDWAVIVMLAARAKVGLGSEDGFCVVVKNNIHLVPLFGWYILQHGYIYVRRFGAFVAQPVVNQLKFLNGLEDPFWLLIFAEGTRFTTKRPDLIKASEDYSKSIDRPPLKNCLVPRAGGVELAIRELDRLSAFYDVTIAYGQTLSEERRGRAPGMLDFVCGPPPGRSLHVHIRRFPIAAVPKDKKALQVWLLDRFQEKDDLLEQWRQNGGQFPDPEQRGEAREPAVACAKTATPTLIFSAALLAPFVFRPVRRLYLYTALTSPFLIAWMHLRRQV